jgi:hypothetical protein
MQNKLNQRQITYGTTSRVGKIISRAISERDTAIQGLTKREHKANITENRQDALSIERKRRVQGLPQVSPDEALAAKLANNEAKPSESPQSAPSSFAAPKRTTRIEELTNKLRNKGKDNDHD